MSTECRPEIVVVTGASAGVGRATAVAFAKHGARVGLLRVVARPGQVAVERAGDDPVAHDGLDRGASDPDLVAVVVGGIKDGLGSHIGLKDRGHRLRFARQAASDPSELRGVEGRHLNHRELDVAAVVDQLAPQGLREALDGVLGGAVSRL